MKSAATILSEFVLENLHTQPVAKRIQLTRSLAEIEPNDTRRRELTRIATSLDRIERRQRKLTLRYRG